MRRRHNTALMVSQKGYSTMHVCAIGAGPAGLTAAYELAKRGVEVDVFEAGEYVGGMARSFSLWNQTVDLGPHRFFSSDAPRESIVARSRSKRLLDDQPADADSLWWKVLSVSA